MIKQDIFDTHLESLLKQKDLKSKISHCVVACSGGPDSTALAFLINDYVKSRGMTLTCLIVDHNLRQESAQEAQQVALYLKSHNIKACILTNSEESPQRNIQDWARHLRYNLIAKWCKAHKTSVVFMGHHLDDQAETVLQRLVRGSGVDGLAGMSSVVLHYGLWFIRPLLPFSKKVLLSFLNQHDIRFVQDPSNNSTFYQRNRIRLLKEKLEQEGLTAKRLANTALIMDMTREYLDGQAKDFMRNEGRIYPQGFLSISYNAFIKLPPILQMRVLVQSLQAISGHIYKPRLTQTLQALEAIRHNSFKGCTLLGVHVFRYHHLLLMVRENRHIEKIDVLQNKSERSFVWDKRFRVNREPLEKDLAFIMQKEGAGPVFLQGLGDKGYQNLPKAIKKSILHLPYAVRVSYPVLRGVKTLPIALCKENENYQALLFQRTKILENIPFSLWDRDTM